MKDHLKKHKKLYIFSFVAIFVAAGLGLSWLYCPEAQFKRYCEEAFCGSAQKILNTQEKKTFVAMKKYLKETGKKTLDADFLKYASVNEVMDMLLKVKAATADVARQGFLDNMLPREKFPGNYDCMRGAYINDLSNEEVLFIQALNGKNLEELMKDQNIRQMYLATTPKIIRCMNENIQKQYLEEIKVLTAPTEAQNKAKEKSEPAAKKETKK